MFHRPYGGADGVLRMIRSVFMDFKRPKCGPSISIFLSFNDDRVSTFELGTWLPRMESAASAFPLQIGRVM